MNVTRGWGFLERILSGWRFAKVLRLLEGRHTQDRILDLGCGPHSCFLPLVQSNSKVGIDLYLRSGAGQGLKGTHLLRCDLQKADPPLRPCSFDAITAIAFLEHLNKHRGEALLKSVHNLLKPNGVLVLTTPAPWTRTVLGLMAAIRLVSPDEIADHKAYYDRESIIKVLVAAGFPASEIRIGTFMAGANYWAMARKQ